MSDDQQAAREAAFRKSSPQGFAKRAARAMDPNAVSHDRSWFDSGFDCGVVWERGRGVPEEGQRIGHRVPNIADDRQLAAVNAGYDAMLDETELTDDFDAAQTIAMAAVNAFAVAGRGVREDAGQVEAAAKAMRDAGLDYRWDSVALARIALAAATRVSPTEDGPLTSKADRDAAVKDECIRAMGRIKATVAGPEPVADVVLSAIRNPQRWCERVQHEYSMVLDAEPLEVWQARAVTAALAAATPDERKD